MKRGIVMDIKIGDMVEIINGGLSNYFNVANKIGKVVKVRDDILFGVAFSDKLVDKDGKIYGSNLDGACEDGYGALFSRSYLKLINEVVVEPLVSSVKCNNVKVEVLIEDNAILFDNATMGGDDIDDFILVLQKAKELLGTK
jgi:hypothetical protein